MIEGLRRVSPEPRLKARSLLFRRITNSLVATDDESRFQVQKTGRRDASGQSTGIAATEVFVLETQERINVLADGIERAYKLLRADWRGGCSSPRVWTVAATVLLQVHANDPAYPSDPVLFVAAQPKRPRYPDPWVELTGEAAARFFRKRVQGIIQSLYRELASEVKRAEARFAAGEAVGTVLLRRSARISPLGKLIVAHRLGRHTLARRFESGALDQHRGCPLYREASRRLLAPELYPVEESRETTDDSPPSSRSLSPVHLN